MRNNGLGNTNKGGEGRPVHLPSKNETTLTPEKKPELVTRKGRLQEIYKSRGLKKKSTQTEGRYS